MLCSRLQSKISDEPSYSDKDINDCDPEDAEKCWEITPANLPTKDSVLTDYQNVFALGEFQFSITSPC